MSRDKEAPQQYKQPSRKGKRAWRKNVDVSEVQSGLESLREEIIQGGPVAEKPSDELFALDTTGSEAIQNAYNKSHKPLKVDEILARRSAVPAVDSRKRPGSRISTGVVEPSSKRLKQNWVSNKELQRLKEIVKTTTHLSADKLEEDEPSNFDLWAENSKFSTQAENFQAEYIPETKPKVAPPTLRRAPIAMTASGKPVPAIKTPNAGTSYNPSFADWDDLLTQEGQKEIEAEKKRIKEEAARAERNARITLAAADDVGTRTDDESAWEGFETEDESTQTLKVKRPERKTQAQKNKIKRRKEAERQAIHEKKRLERRREPGISKTKDVITADGNELSGDLAKDSYLSESGDETQLRRRRLGNIAIPDKALEVVLPEELQESLRRLKPEGNLLNDRFRNLLVNGKLEARKQILQPKKVRRKYTEKWTHKDFKIEV